MIWVFFCKNNLPANVGGESLFLSVQHKIRILSWKSRFKKLLMCFFLFTKGKSDKIAAKCGFFNSFSIHFKTFPVNT